MALEFLTTRHKLRDEYYAFAPKTPTNETFCLVIDLPDHHTSVS